MESAPQNGAPTTATGGEKRTLPADVWDRLKAKADEVGGVGAGQLFEDDTFDGQSRPLCLFGIAQAVDERFVRYEFDLGGVCTRTLRSVTVPWAVDSLFSVPGWKLSDRRPFEAVMAELGISRAEEAASA